MGSKFTVMEYDFHNLRFRKQHQLDPSWLSLKADNNLPIVIEGVTWLKI